MGSRVELFAAIRRDERVEGLSIRQLAERHQGAPPHGPAGVGVAIPPERKTPVRVSRRLEEFKPVIDAMLREDLDAPRKQRTPPAGSWPGWLTSIRPSRCRTRRCGTTSPAAARRS